MVSYDVLGIALLAAWCIGSVSVGSVNVFYLPSAMLWEAGALLVAFVRVCVRQCVCVSLCRNWRPSDQKLV